MRIRKGNNETEDKKQTKKDKELEEQEELAKEKDKIFFDFYTP